jgi:hypothetical protein
MSKGSGARCHGLQLSRIAEQPGECGRQTSLRPIVFQQHDSRSALNQHLSILSLVIRLPPVDSEKGLRNIDWIEANRRKVDQLSAGKVAYIYMPNTAGAAAGCPGLTERAARIDQRESCS